MPFVNNAVSTNPTEYYDHVAFSDQRRSKNSSNTFDVNVFFQTVKDHMEQKHSEHQVARFKSVTRFEEKCDYIDTVIFQAVSEFCKHQSESNAKAMVDAFEEGVKRFTTFGKMSGLAEIFESAYFALTTKTMVKEYDHRYCGVVDKEVINVSTKSSNFEMSAQTAAVFIKPTAAVVVDPKNASIAIGVPVHVSAQVGVTKERSVNSNSWGFFAMMRGVQVPQHAIPTVEENVSRTRCTA